MPINRILTLDNNQSVGGFIWRNVESGDFNNRWPFYTGLLNVKPFIRTNQIFEKLNLGDSLILSADFENFTFLVFLYGP